jgi:hypothetical protein
VTGTGRTAGGSGCELAAGGAAPVPLLAIVVVADGTELGTAADTAGTAADTAGTAAFATGADVAVAPPPLASPTLATVASLASLPASFPFTALPVALAPNILAHDSGPTTYKQANAQVRALYVLVALTLHETTEMQLPPSSTRTFALAHRLLRGVTVINQVFIMQT